MKTKRFGLVGLLLLAGLVQEPFVPTSVGLHQLLRSNPGSGLTRRPVAIPQTSNWSSLAEVGVKGSRSEPAQTTAKPPEPPKIAVSCVLHNHQYDLIDAKTKAVVEKDDWRVTCTVTWKKDKVYDAELPLARPTEFRDAMLAVDEFRTKRAPQLVKEWEDARRSK